MTVLTNAFEINCSGTEGDHVSLEVWKIKGDITSLYKFIKELEKTNNLITYALLVPNHLYIFFVVRCHLSLKQNIQTIIDEQSDLSVEKRQFNDFKELNSEESKLLTVSVKNWIRNTLIIEHSHKAQGSFIYPSNSEKYFSTENGTMVSICGFTLSCIIFTNLSLKVFINLKNKMFKKINTDESSLRSYSKNKTPSWVLTPFKGILGRLTTKEKDKSRSNENSNMQNQVTVLLEGTPISFECNDYLLSLDSNDQSLERYFPSQRNLPRQNPQSRSKIQKQKISSTPSNNASKNNKRTSNDASTNGKNTSSKKTKMQSETDMAKEEVLPAYMYNRKEKKNTTNNLTLSPTLNNVTDPISSITESAIDEFANIINNPIPQPSSSLMDATIPPEPSSQSQRAEVDAQLLTADQFNELLDSFDCWGPSDAEIASQPEPQPTPQIKTESIVETPVDIQPLNSTPFNPQTPSQSVTSTPNRPYEEIKQFKEILEHRESQRKNVQDLQRGLTQMNLNYEPEVRQTRQYSSFTSSFVGIKDERSSNQKQEIAKNDYSSYFTNPCYNSSSNEDRIYPTRTNFVPTSNYPENRLFNLPQNEYAQMLKEQERKLRKEKKEKKEKKKKEEVKETNDQAVPSNVEESFEEEIFFYDFCHSDATDMFEIIPQQNSQWSLSEILKKSLELISNESEFNKSDILSFIMDGCWKDSETPCEYPQKSVKLSNNTMEVIQVVSRCNFQTDDLSNDLTLTDESLPILYKVSDILSRVGDETIKGPLKDISSILQLDTPTVRVGYMEQWLDSQPDIISEWEKSLLEPYASPKRINFCVIGVEPAQFNVNDGVYSDLYGFFENLSTIYEICKLGTHVPIHNEFITDGIVPIAYKYSQPSPSGTKSQKIQLEEFIEQFQKSAKKVEQGIINFYNNYSKEECVLIYVVFPFHLIEKIEATSTASVSTILYNVFGTIIDNLQLEIPDVIPFIHFVDQKLVDEPYIHRPIATLKHISLSAFNKCRRQQKRWNNWNGYSSLLHEPSVVLTPMVLNQDTSRNPSPYAELQSLKLILFCAYSITEVENGEFFVTCVWTDYPGNLLESAIFESSEYMTDEGRRSNVIDAIIQKIHEQSTTYMSSLALGNQLDLFWEYTICKVAPTNKCTSVHMSEEELNAWTKVRASVLKGAMYLTSLNDNPSTQFFKISSPESTPSLHFHEDYGYIFTPSEEEARVDRVNQDQDSSRQEVVVYPKSVLEVRLFVKETEKNLHTFNVRQVCKQLFNLSWLTVSPLYPSRYTVLPIHIQLLRNINTNINRYIQYKSSQK
ncbi:predicted protein [Naegleria gruberi]|uniref:Mediator of RNA polymerase II transcription subunit 13 n=1 Tax=Naegleria gruberi TaxID=5762 RepID=D2VGR4_NAEGR|nr:uncharacterized protein NAEGRDRAFT_68069 [Naegleria gruberi]EFC44013.1 predicted protein [Naegleria gruberi]|eukprot:XP_002676757.1 predicted protein [Naegleria gruberi strain NEG-M]